MKQNFSILLLFLTLNVFAQSSIKDSYRMLVEQMESDTLASIEAFTSGSLGPRPSVQDKSDAEISQEIGRLKFAVFSAYKGFVIDKYFAELYNQNQKGIKKAIQSFVTAMATSNCDTLIKIHISSMDSINILSVIDKANYFDTTVVSFEISKLIFSHYTVFSPEEIVSFIATHRFAYEDRLYEKTHLLSFKFFKKGMGLGNYLKTIDTKDQKDFIDGFANKKNLSNFVMNEDMKKIGFISESLVVIDDAYLADFHEGNTEHLKSKQRLVLIKINGVWKVCSSREKR